MTLTWFPPGTIRANVAELAGELVKAFVSNQVRQRILGPKAIRVSPEARPTPGESPPEDDVGCPYCAIARELAAAHRYMKRADVSPNFGTTYQELARRHIVGAAQTLTGLPNLTKAKSAGLLHLLANLEEDLNIPHRKGQYSGIAAMIWEASDKALDLAEEFQEDSQVIDAEVRELDGETGVR